jgi:hypothetical protein
LLAQPHTSGIFLFHYEAVQNEQALNEVIEIFVLGTERSDLRVVGKVNLAFLALLVGLGAVLAPLVGLLGIEYLRYLRVC